jgi:hypothetical protein
MAIKVDDLTFDQMPDVAASVYDHVATTRREPTRRDNNWASEIGHPCEKYLVYCRTHGEQAKIHTTELQFVFNLGKRMEQEARQELEEAGYDLRGQVKPWPDQARITGYIDGMLTHRAWEIPGRFPCEMKGMASHFAGKVREIKQRLHATDPKGASEEILRYFLEHRRPWMRKYPAQLLTYMYLIGSPWGLFYIKDKMSGVPVSFWVHLDPDGGWILDYLAGIFEKAERVNAHVEAGTLPESCDDAEVCDKCRFFHLCLPDLTAAATELVLDDELVEMVARHEELKPLYREYERIHAKLCKGAEARLQLPKGESRGSFVVGEYLVKGTRVDNPGDPNPPKPRPKAPYSYNLWKMVKMVESAEAEDDG